MLNTGRSKAGDIDGMQTSSSMYGACKYKRPTICRHECNTVFMLSVFMCLETISVNLYVLAAVVWTWSWLLSRKPGIRNSAGDISKRHPDANSKDVIVNV